MAEKEQPRSSQHFASHLKNSGMRHISLTKSCTCSSQRLTQALALLHSIRMSIGLFSAG